MQVTEKRNFMVLAIHYTDRAREIFHVSRVSWLSFTLYIAENEYILGKRQNKKQKTKKKKKKTQGRYV